MRYVRFLAHMLKIKIFVINRRNFETRSLGWKMDANQQSEANDCCAALLAVQNLLNLIPKKPDMRLDGVYEVYDDRLSTLYTF